MAVFCTDDLRAKPAAHAIAEMQTPAHRALMTVFSRIADEWLTDGSIIA